MSPEAKKFSIKSGLLMPGLMLIGLMVVLPVAAGLVFAMRVDGGWSLKNFHVVLTEDSYQRVLYNTLLISLIVTVVSIGIAFPVCFYIAKSSRLIASLFLAAMTVVLSISLLVRTYSWQVILAYNGPVNGLLLMLNLIEERHTLLFSKFAVTLAMVQFMLPYAALIIFSAMRRVDQDILLAARTLGANPLKTFVSAYWPQVNGAVLMASVLVFSVSTGFFVTPAVLGGPSEMMIGTQIHSDLVFNHENGAGLAAAQGVILSVLLALVATLTIRLGGPGFLRAVGK